VGGGSNLRLIERGRGGGGEPREQESNQLKENFPERTEGESVGRRCGGGGAVDEKPGDQRNEKKMKGVGRKFRT